MEMEIFILIYWHKYRDVYGRILCGGQKKTGKLRRFISRRMVEYILAHPCYAILCKIKRMIYNYMCIVPDWLLGYKSKFRVMCIIW